MVQSAGASAGMSSGPSAVTLTITGPRWVCQGNCAPGCTVNLATTVRDGSSEFTTRVGPPSSLILTLRSTSSVNTARPVKNSVAMGGGGSCAPDGRTFPPIRRTATNAAANAATRFRFITGSSLAGRRRAIHALPRPPAPEGGDRTAGEGTVNLAREVDTGKLEGYVGLGR